MKKVEISGFYFKITDGAIREMFHPFGLVGVEYQGGSGEFYLVDEDGVSSVAKNVGNEEAVVEILKILMEADTWAPMEVPESFASVVEDYIFKNFGDFLMQHGVKVTQEISEIYVPLIPPHLAHGMEITGVSFYPLQDHASFHYIDELGQSMKMIAIALTQPSFILSEAERKVINSIRDKVKEALDWDLYKNVRHLLEEK